MKKPRLPRDLKTRRAFERLGRAQLVVPMPSHFVRPPWWRRCRPARDFLLGTALGLAIGVGAVALYMTLKPKPPVYTQPAARQPDPEPPPFKRQHPAPWEE